MWNPVRIATVGNSVGTAMLVLALALSPAAPCRLQGAEPPGQEWIGQRVIPKQPDFRLRDAEGGPERPAKLTIYRVDEVKGGSLRLSPDSGTRGWAAADQVVLLDQAVDFFSDGIRHSPRDAHNYAMRALVMLFTRDDTKHALADCDDAIRLDPKYAFASLTSMRPSDSTRLKRRPTSIEACCGWFKRSTTRRSLT